MAETDDCKYSVGYKKPPRHTQFKPGQSGNVRGRPKGAKNFATVIEEELQVPIEVTEKGKRKRISKRQAIAKQHINKAVAGDPKATAIVLNEVREHESQNPPPAAPCALGSPEDKKVMDNILRRIRQSNPAFLDPGSHSDPASDDQPAPLPRPNEGEL